MTQGVLLALALGLDCTGTGLNLVLLGNTLVKNKVLSIQVKILAH